MSLTRTPGVYRASHWVSVSAALVEYLDHLLGTYRNMPKVEVPTRAVEALLRLLSSALSAARNELPENPQVNINDYLVVREALRMTRAQSLEREDVGKAIEEYVSLLNQLLKPHEMKDLPHELAVKTRIFFRYLQTDGESDRYDQYMRQAHPYNHPKDQTDDNDD